MLVKSGFSLSVAESSANFDDVFGLQLKEKLQGDLNHSRAYIGLHLSEGGGFNIAHRQPKVRVIQKIEKLSSELQLFGFGQVNGLERREVPVDVTRPEHGVPALIPEYLKASLRVWLKWLAERAYIEPFRGGAWAGVWISNHVGHIARESGNFRSLALQGNIIGIEDREWGSTHRGKNSVQLPIPENFSVPLVRVLEER